MNKSWYLDKGRQKPVLRIVRRQLPLAPAFAITAHSAQGQTLRAAIIDLQIGKKTSPITSYVAPSRVKRREDVLILRPFHRRIFTGGPLAGASLLLRVFQGEEVDWAAIEEARMPKRACGRCGLRQRKDGFLAAQWKKAEDQPTCKTCQGKCEGGRRDAAAAARSG